MRLIPAIDRHPRIVAIGARPAGRVAMLASFACLLLLAHFPWWAEAAAVLALMAVFPARRRLLLTLSTLYWALAHPIMDRRDLLRTVADQEGLGGTIDASRTSQAMLLATLVLLAAIAAAAFRGTPPLLARRPLLTLHVAYGLVLLSACFLPLSGLPRVLAWAFAGTAGGYLWYFGYTLLDRSSPDRDPVHLQVGTYFPLWAAAMRGSLVPFVKGAAYLRKIESKTPEELAVCQLKAIKLLCWALILRVTLSVLTLVVHGHDDGSRAAHLAGQLWALGGTGAVPHLALPTFEQAFARSVQRQPYAWYVCWGSLIARFLRQLLDITIDGGIVVACCRMAGFRALRNTWRPLEARSIAEFWNRYYFYFKEMLVDFFFYPTFIRYFKRHRRLRIAAATFAAAGFGNLEYHFLRDPDYIVDLGLWRAVTGFHVYAFYVLVLATGIAVSQLRSRRGSSAPPRGLRERVLAPAGVALFYCMLTIFDDTGRRAAIGEHFRFFFHLFAVS